ncbi:fimbrial protein [Dyella sp. C11]|uniref:fimbrial protein n=1 Tax=Dyella sp. C11 TaxID=2126991 RepID=UPI00130080CC|nr:fimbrial protein [Dyella sp. C11]
MKKLLLSAVVAASLGFAGLAAAATTQSVDGTVNFTGAVTGSTCTVNINSAGTTASVVLPTVQTSELGTTLGSTAGYTPFTIALSNCTASDGKTKVAPYFLPSTNILTDGNLKNTSSTGTPATGVEIALSTDAAGASRLNLNAGTVAGQGSTAATFTTGTASFTYYAAYYGTGTVTAGTVASTVQFNLAYQ